MDTRKQLRNEIIDTRQRFQHLLDRVPDEAFHLPSDNSARTIGQVLYHMSLAPRFLIADVRMFTHPSWIYRLAGRVFPGSLFNWLNARLTRFGARRLSRQFLVDEYDRAHETAIKALDSVSEENFQMSLLCPGWDPVLSGEVTLERLFHYVKDHFDSHAAQIAGRLDASERWYAESN
jgi:hypothetical protein